MQIFEMMARYVWPVVLMWNVFLFQGQQVNERKFAEYKLYVAQNYTSKADLKYMFDEQKLWFNEKLEITKEMRN